MVLFPLQFQFILVLLKIEIPKNIFTRNFRLIENFKDLPKSPSILVVNYCQSRMEFLAFKLIPVDFSFIYAYRLKNIISIYFDNPIYKKTDQNSFQDIKKEIQNHTNSGRYIVSYVSIPTHHLGINRMRSGIFRIAKELNIPITPVCIDYIHNFFGYIPSQNFQIKIGETFYVQDIQESVNKTRNFYKENLDLFIRTKFE